MSMNVAELLIGDLAVRHPGVTPAIADSYLEAATVCLTRHHISPVEFLISSEEEETRALVNWIEANERQRGAWANADDATRDGAYSCALASVELTAGLVAVRRAETLTGADYYVGRSKDLGADLESLQRLEVSGTDLGEHGVIVARVKGKVIQTEKGRSNLPAIVCVVGFNALRIIIKAVEIT